MKVLVTMDVFEGREELLAHEGLEYVYRYHKSVQEEDVRDIDILLGNIPREFYESAEKLKYVHLPMAGSDLIAKLIQGRNIQLTNSTGAFSLSIAEHMIGMILYFYKNLDGYVEHQRQHIFQRLGETKSIFGSKVLVIGCGNIGMTFAEKMHLLGAEVVGIKRTPGKKADFLKELDTIDHLEDYLKEADIVALSLPQNDDTRHLMDAKRLSMMKDGALLINVGRGSAVDTSALIKELQKQRIYAALDVYEEEPLPADNPLWDQKNILMLPHSTGSICLEYSRDQLREIAAYNLDAYLNGKPLRNPVDFLTGYKISNI